MFANERHITMLKWIIIFLVIAAVASMFGLPRLAGTASAAARLLIFVVLILFLLTLIGVVTIAG